MTVKINPYIAGAPVVESSLFFGRKDVFAWISHALIGKYVDHILVIHGQRRVGKTSVLKQLPNRLPASYVQVFLDLQGRVSTSLDRFLWWMAREITKTLQSHQIDLPAPDREAFTRDPDYFEASFLPQLTQALGDKNLLLTFDEFDTLDSPAGRDGFVHPMMTALQQFMDRPKITLIFSIGSSGRKLENMQAAYTSFFKQALYKKISFLEEKDAQDLITQPVAGVLEYTPEAIQQIYRVTSGHPYFIQLICHELFSTCQKVDRWVVHAHHVEDVLDAVIERGTVNLKYVWDDAPPLGKWILGLLAEAEENLDEAGLTRALNRERVRFSQPDLASELLRLHEKDILTPDNRFVVQLMRLWLQRNRPMERVREELLETNPIANRFIEIGEEYQDQHEYDLAAENFNKALATDPENIRARVNLGFIAVKQQDYPGAVSHFEEALNLDTEDVLARNGMCQANLGLGAASLSRGEIEKAAGYYHQVLKYDSEHQDAHQKLRLLNQALENYEQAQVALKRKDYAQAASLLKEVILVSERYKDASILLAQAVAAQRRRRPAWLSWRLGFAFLSLGIVITLVWLVAANLETLRAWVSSLPPAAQLFARATPTLRATKTSVVKAAASVAPVPAWVGDFARPNMELLADMIPTIEDQFEQPDPWGVLEDGLTFQDGVLHFLGMSAQFGGSHLQAIDYGLEYTFAPKASNPSMTGFEFRTGEEVYDFTLFISQPSGIQTNHDWEFTQNGEQLTSGVTQDVNLGKENYVKIIHVDGQLAIFLNGTPLAYTESYIVGWGQLNLTFGSVNDVDPVEFELDHLKFWSLDPPWVNDSAASLISHVASHSPDLYEDFTSSNGDWTQFDPNLRIDDGVLEYQGTGVWLAPEALRQVQDFAIQLDLIVQNESDLPRVAIAFRSNDDAQDEPQGQYEFYLEQASESDPFPLIGLQKIGPAIDFQLFQGQGPSLEPGQAIRILLMMERNRMELFLNGKPVTYQEDGTWGDGDLRIYLGSREGEPPVQLQIDNLKYWVPMPDWVKNFARPVLQSIENQSPDFMEDFSEIRPEWDQALDAGAAIENGVLTYTGPRLGFSFDQLFLGRNFVLQYILTPHTHDQFQYFNIQFRSFGDQFYTFGLDYGDASMPSNGRWEMLKHREPEQWPMYIDDSLTTESNGWFDRLTFNQPNLVTLIARDYQFGVYINDEPVGIAEDREYQADSLWLNFGSLGSETPIHIEIDDIQIWDLDSKE